MTDGGLFFFAGIYERATEVRPDTHLVFTTAPNELMSEIHDRMPAILTDERAKAWLEPGEITAEKFAELTAPFPSSEMTARTVSALVNSPKNDTPQIFEAPSGEIF